MGSAAQAVVRALVRAHSLLVQRQVPGSAALLAALALVLVLAGVDRPALASAALLAVALAQALVAESLEPVH